MKLLSQKADPVIMRVWIDKKVCYKLTGCCVGSMMNKIYYLWLHSTKPPAHCQFSFRHRVLGFILNQF